MGNNSNCSKTRHYYRIKSSFPSAVGQPHQYQNGIQTTIKIYSQQEEQSMIQIINHRKKILCSPYICTVQQYEIEDDNSSSNFLKKTCQYNNVMYLKYPPTSLILSQVPLEQYRIYFPSVEVIYDFIISLASGLLIYKQNNLHHGDLHTDNICYSEGKKTWQILDIIYLKYGVNAYESVLQGQEGFITPLQIQRIRHGFIRQSPQQTEKDDVFGLGMIILQVASITSSIQCYDPSFLRINQQNIQSHLKIVRQKYGNSLAKLIALMLEFNEDCRAIIADILQDQEVMRRKRRTLKRNNNLQNQIRNHKSVNHKVIPEVNPINSHQQIKNINLSSKSIQSKYSSRDSNSFYKSHQKTSLAKKNKSQNGQSYISNGTQFSSKQPQSNRLSEKYVMDSHRPPLPPNNTKPSTVHASRSNMNLNIQNSNKQAYASKHTTQQSIKEQKNRINHAKQHY